MKNGSTGTRQRRRGRRSLHRALAAGTLAAGTLVSAHAQSSGALQPRRMPSAAAIDARWQQSFDAFAAADLARAPRPGGVVFVGSSSIRMWDDLESSFESKPLIVKRGFGGSRLSDCSTNLHRLVLPYKPALVVVYAGDNDLAEGATPEDVLRSFKDLVEGIHAELPETRIAYLSIKPSPLREALMPSAHAANALIQAYAQGQPRLEFVDVYSKMLGPDCKPRADLFAGDRLHLNAAGYALWKRELATRLKL